MWHVSIRDFKYKNSDFLNSNTCFCLLLYGNSVFFSILTKKCQHQSPLRKSCHRVVGASVLFMVHIFFFSAICLFFGGLFAVFVLHLFLEIDEWWILKYSTFFACRQTWRLEVCRPDIFSDFFYSRQWTKHFGFYYDFFKIHWLPKNVGFSLSNPIFSQIPTERFMRFLRLFNQLERIFFIRR